MKTWIHAALVLICTMRMCVAAADAATAEQPRKRPNIVFVFADDWGRYAHCLTAFKEGPSINDVLRTPTIDAIAAQGVVFRNAFVTAPSCTPCRSSVLSGRYFFQTQKGTHLYGEWDPAIPSYPLLLRDSGYHIGKSYKVWGPGYPNDAPYGKQEYAYEKAGRAYNRFSQNATRFVREGKTIEEAKAILYNEVRENFRAFLNARPKAAPLCYWFGPTHTHRTFEKGSGKALWHIDPDSLKGKLPHFLPDVPEIREDFSDYMGEIQALDAGIAILEEELKAIGEWENTIIVLSGDHGVPGIPRGKCNLYDCGVAVSLIVKGPQIKPGRIVDDYVNLMEIAPTFLEIGGVAKPTGMTATSFLPTLLSDKAGQVDPKRTWVITGRERHFPTAREGNLPYPQRALRTPDFLYVRNFAPERSPMGAQKFTNRSDVPSLAVLETNTGAAFPDVDASPTKAWLLHQFDNPQWQQHYALAFGLRPAEELYDLRTDPQQVRNVANNPDYRAKCKELWTFLEAELRRQNDPRIRDGGVTFESPDYLAVREKKF